MSGKFRKKKEDAGKLVRQFEAALKGHSGELFEIQSYEAIVEYYLARSKYSKAMVAVDHAIQLYPFSSELIPLKAHILTKLKRHEEALDLLERVRLIHPTDPEVCLAMGGALSASGRNEEAIRTYECALANAGENADELYYRIGLSLQALGRREEAANAYKKAVGVGMSHEGALYELSSCLELESSLEKSLPYYERFIDENPYSAMAWFSLGTVYEKLKKPLEALEAYEYAVAIDDDFSDAHFCIGHIYMRLGENHKALGSFQRTLALEGPGAEVYCAMGAAYEGMERYDLGIKYFQKSAKLDSFYDEAWFGVGSCMTKQDRWYQALHFFNEAIKLNNRHPSYWTAAAKAEYQVGNIVSSIGAYEQAALLAPEDEEIWLGWSMIYYEQGEYDKAAKILGNGIEELPDNASLRYRMVVYLAEGGRAKKAIYHLEQALKLDFDKHTVLFDFFPKMGMQSVFLKAIHNFGQNHSA